MSNIELVSSKEHESYHVHDLLFAGHSVTVERHADWLTTAYWTMPDEYSFEDFLRVTEDMLQEGEENGWESDSPNKIDIVVCSPKLEELVECETYRPLAREDFEGLGITAEDVTLLRINSDLAQFTFSRGKSQVGLLFYEKPHQTRSAFHFMSELLPKDGRLEPQEIGQFILGLAR